MPCPLQVPKCFVPVQIFWASPKLWLHLVPLQNLLCWHKKKSLNANHLFGWHKMFATSPIFKYIFGHAQKIWTSTIHLGTCKRTRHYFNSIKYRFSGLQVQKLVKKIFKKLSRISFKVYVSNYKLWATFELGFFNFSWA